MTRLYSTSEIASKYNRFAKWYDFIEAVFELFIWRYRKQLLSLARGKVLEVGIGTGRSLRYYPADADIIGIDMSREMLKKAKEKSDKLRRHIRLKIGDAENLLYDSQGFDIVVDTLGLCTYSKPIKVLREMKRVCKPRGRILLLEHGVSNLKWLCRLQECREKKHYETLGCSLLRNPEKLVKEAGLKFIGIERKLFGVIYIIVARR